MRTPLLDRLRRTVVIAIAAQLTASALVAPASAQAPPDTVLLERIVVTATRTPLPLSAVNFPL
jgi:outer membrane cobalamin receptor